MAEPPSSNLNKHKTDRQKEQDNELVLSYTTMRNLIGFSGMLLPFVLMLFTKEADGLFVEPSISDYYYTKNGDILVVLLSVLGVFLITYNGYDWKEKVLTTLAAFCAIGAWCSSEILPARSPRPSSWRSSRPSASHRRRTRSAP